MNTLEKLELFGKEVTANLRDVSIDEYILIKSGQVKSRDAQDMFNIYTSIDKVYYDKIDKLVLNVIDRVLHNCLWMFEQSNEFTVAPKSSVNPDEDIVELSDGLSGELYSEEGWIEKYSKYPSGTTN